MSSPWCECTGTRFVENNQICGTCRKFIKSLASNHEIVVQENYKYRDALKAILGVKCKIVANYGEHESECQKIAREALKQ